MRVLRTRTMQEIRCRPEETIALHLSIEERNDTAALVAGERIYNPL
jgi:hypothetical protein